MTPEQQNQAIAEACGKQHCPSCPNVPTNHWKVGGLNL